MERKRIDEVANTLDDIATTLDEMKEDGCEAGAQTLDRMRRSIESARDAIDRIENMEPNQERLHSTRGSSQDAE
jgi:uncharacterized protein Yka (UPF0111/DUF47 family)